jgi:DNA-binding MarR family transcriptional regulator
MSALAPCTCTALRKTSRAVTRVYDEAMAPAGITISQFAILRTLRRQGPLPLSRLAERMVMERTSLYRMLAPLETRHLIRIEAGAGRARSASIADAGEKLLDESDAVWSETQQRFVAALGHEKWTALQALLAEVTQAAERIRA